jgi:hypothetical protein
MSEPEESCRRGDAECLDTLKLSNLDGLLMEDMRRHAAFNRPLLSKAVRHNAEVVEGTGDLARLRRENAELRARVEELERTLLAASGKAPAADTEFELGAWTTKDYEMLLKEKSEIIRTLNMQIHELQRTLGAAPQPPATGPNELGTMSRRHLVEDKEALILLMRQMHRAMSKDQAEISRQRDQIERLRQELNQ